MDPEIPLPDPPPAGVEFLCSDQPVLIVDLVVHHCPPGTPAPPRPNRPRLPKLEAEDTAGKEPTT